MLGKCELSKKKCDENVIPSVEDYLWYNLCLLTYPGQGDQSGSEYVLETMRNTMKKYGKAYFGEMYTKVIHFVISF